LCCVLYSKIEENTSANIAQNNNLIFASAKCFDAIFDMFIFRMFKIRKFYFGNYIKKKT